MIVTECQRNTLAWNVTSWHYAAVKLSVVALVLQFILMQHISYILVYSWYVHISFVLVSLDTICRIWSSMCALTAYSFKKPWMIKGYLIVYQKWIQLTGSHNDSWVNLTFFLYWNNLLWRWNLQRLVSGAAKNTGQRIRPLHLQASTVQVCLWQWSVPLDIISRAADVDHDHLVMLI